MNLLCPHCNQVLAVPDHAAGLKVSCPLCHSAFLAPHPPAPPPAPPSLPQRSEGPATAAAEPAAAPEPPPAPAPQPAAAEAGPRHLTLLLTAALWRRVVVVSFVLLLVLLFLPWERVLLPSQLGAAGRSGGALNSLALVLDCSASMNEQLPDGEIKIQTLKKAVGDLIDQLPEGLHLAFLVYGRDRETPCKVEVVRKLGPLDAEARFQIKTVLKGLAPSGQAPLADALRQAGEELAAAPEGGGGIVVLTDGPDTCGGDASARAAALAKDRASGYGVHIIAFGAAPRELRALRGTAVAGKGQIHDAQTASELREALAALRADARQSAARQALAGAAGGGLSGVRTAFGSGPVPAAPLMILYCVLALVSLLAAVALLLLARRRIAWLAPAVAAAAAAALLVLLLQLILGFPVEKAFREHAFTIRTLWLFLAILVNVVALLAALVLYRLERRAPGRPAPRVEVTW